MSRPAHVAVVTGPDPGHALPCLGVARALAAAGHRCTIATGDRWRALTEAEGHRFVRLPGLAPTGDDHDLAHVLWTRAGAMAPPLAELLTADVPDLFLVDGLTNAGGFAAGLLRVPWVQLHPHHLTDPDPWLAPVGLGRRPSRMPWRRLDDAHLRRRQAASLAEGQRVRGEARVAAGLPADGGHPVARLFQAVPSLEPRRSVWPADAHLVGPVALDLPGPPLVPPAGDGPLVVVTDTTASAHARGLGALALEALTGRGLRLVVTGEVDADVPDDAVVGRGPHGPLLAEAAVAVGPGGGGFTAKVLAAGVPLVVVPGAGDQRETAARVGTASAGVALPPSGGSPRRLRRAVDRALRDGRLHAGAARAATSCRGLGPEHAAAIVARHLPSAEQEAVDT